MKPVLFAAGVVPAYRVPGLARLHELEGIEVALFGGRSRHGGPVSEAELPLPSRRVGPAQLAALAASGRYRAVVCPTAGRLAPLSAWAGARRGGVPLILWASLWAHPRSVAHAFTYLPLGRLYRSADAVVTYGPHVSRYVASRGARNIQVAPQAVDNDFWRAPCAGEPSVPGRPADERIRFLFVGRPAAEKGLDVLLDAWSAAAGRMAPAALALVGVGVGFAPEARARASGGTGGGEITCSDPLAPEQLRDVYAASDVLVLPSIATATFREPWGLVVNEAMNRGLAVIASDAVGAVAGGLVKDGENGLVVPAGDAAALGAAIERLAGDGGLRAAMGVAGRREVESYTYDAWARGFSRALATVGLARERW